MIYFTSHNTVLPLVNTKATGCQSAWPVFPTPEEEDDVPVSPLS